MRITATSKTVAIRGPLRSGAVELAVSTSKPATQGGQAGGASPALFWLKPGVSYAQVAAALNNLGSAPDAPTPLNKLGLLQASFEVSKGHPTTDQLVLRTGKYLLMDIGDGPPSSWTFAHFTVTGSAHPARLPRPVASITMGDFRFTGASRLRRGELLRVIAAGGEDHMAIALKVPAGSTAAKIITLLKHGKDDEVNHLIKQQAPLMNTVSPGAVNQHPVTLTRGTWVLACFMANRQGVEHTRLGMEKAITVS